MRGSGRKEGSIPRLRHTVEQILAKRRDAEVARSKGQPIVQACRTVSITEQTCYHWRHEYGGLRSHHVKRLKNPNQGPCD